MKKQRDGKSQSSQTGMLSIDRHWLRNGLLNCWIDYEFPDKYVPRFQMQELTGYKRFSAQAQWLRQNDIRYESAADGSILLLKEELEAYWFSSGLPVKAEYKF